MKNLPFRLGFSTGICRAPVMRHLLLACSRAALVLKVFPQVQRRYLAVGPRLVDSGQHV